MQSLMIEAGNTTCTITAGARGPIGGGNIKQWWMPSQRVSHNCGGRRLIYILIYNISLDDNETPPELAQMIDQLSTFSHKIWTVYLL